MLPVTTVGMKVADLPQVGVRCAVLVRESRATTRSCGSAAGR
jgi:hypothetical protein